MKVITVLITCASIIIFNWLAGEIPPLEDMPDDLDRLRTRDTSVIPKSTRKKQVAKSPKKKKQAQGEFGGFKRGFLNPSPSDQVPKKISPVKKPNIKPTTSTEKESKTSGKDDVPHIKPKSKVSGLELPEVQEAMKDTFPFLEKNGWSDLYSVNYISVFS